MRGMTLMLMVALALQAEVHAGDIVQLVSGPAYERSEDFEVSGLTVRGFKLRDGAATKGASYFLVRAANAAGWTYAYRIDRTGAGLDVHVLAAAADPATADATRVASSAKSTGRALVEQAVGAGPSWADHKRFLSAAHARDAATAHAGWRRVVRSLERAHDEHQGHLGILRDLIVAYIQLNAFERGTLTAANLCRLLPARIAEYETAVGGRSTLSAGEQRTFTRARALLLFECGLYPLADALVVEANDPQLASLRRSMAALGQTDFSKRDAFTVRGELAEYDVRVIETGGNPPSGKLLHDELYFLTRLEGSEAPVGRVWYSLTRQALDGTPRYYLYGRSGESRSLLMMYGKQRPEYEVVRADVERAMTRALVAPPARIRMTDDELFLRVMKIALVAAAALAGLAFLVSWRRRRQR